MSKLSELKRVFENRCKRRKLGRMVDLPRKDIRWLIKNLEITLSQLTYIEDVEMNQQGKCNYHWLTKFLDKVGRPDGQSN